MAAQLKALIVVLRFLALITNCVDGSRELVESISSPQVSAHAPMAHNTFTLLKENNHRE